MKKSELKLFAVASRILAKYSQGQTLQQIIENAAGGGDKSELGIMNFPAQLKKDQADMNINVTISPATFGSPNITVSAPAVEPKEVAGNYARLPDQIKKYLEKNISGFPQIQSGTTTLRFYGRPPEEGESGIATN